ncbi:MAG: ChbG/HpnK family deacetylase [Planctomycetaceae bacterium]|jgi:predicted glycoside hydrolase/deacetylase ChbG (UPF0249 family)|nr:ChbG/HpnK family deacetylase [Planctomycetaceae bacterium]
MLRNYTMNSVKKLIINADDLGFSPAVNAAIVNGAAAGNITAASLMVNMPFAEEAAQQVQSYCSDLSLALHFTLTSGKPVSQPSKIPLLINSQGMFRWGFLGLIQVLLSKKRDPFLQQIQTEFSSQIRRMDELAAKYRLHFDHLDSHQHVHVISGIFELLQNEAEKRNLSLRIPRENFCSFKRIIKRFRSWFPQGFAKRAILNHYLKYTKQEIGYFGILESGKMDEYSLQEIIHVLDSNHVNFNRYEINSHPSDFSVSTNDNSLCCSVGDYYFHYSPQRVKEFQALQNAKFQDAIKKYNIKLTGFPRMKIEPIF